MALDVCKFCGCIGRDEEPNCSSLDQAYERTEHRPLGCPWFDDESRKMFPAEQKDRTNG